MRLFNHYHSKLYNQIRSDFWNFELSVWLHTIARSLISIFIPIFLLLAGYSLQAVLLYYLVIHVFDVPLNFLARHLIIKFGARVVIILATVISILYFAIFYHLTAGSWTILFILAVLDAFYDSSYWVAHIYLFIESSGQPAQAGKNTGILASIRSFGGMLGPALGAAILLLENKNSLIISSIVIFALSILPLLNLRHIKDKPTLTRISFKEFFSELRERRDYLSLMLYSINSTTENILWPIFIFTVLGTLKSISLVAVIVSVSTIIFTYFMGTIAKKKQSKLIIIGSVTIAIIWILRLIFPSHLMYYMTVFVIGFFAIMINIPLESNVVERAKIKDSLLASTFRNASTMLPQILIFGALAVVVGVFKVSFIIAIVSLFALILVNRLFLVLMNKLPGKN